VAAMRRLSPGPRAYHLAALAVRLVAPNKGALFRACASPQVQRVIKDMADTRGALAIVGASWHTQWLLATTPLRRLQPRAVLVDGAHPGVTFCGLPVRDIRAALRLGVSELLVTQPEPPRGLAEQIDLLIARGVVVVNPFDALPPDPTPNIERLEPHASAQGHGDVPLVGYLARKAEGIVPFTRFVAAYRAMSAGAAHQLLIIYKGFGSLEETASYREHLQDLPHAHTFVDDVGFDLGAYFEVFRRFRFPSYMFLGSFCVPQAPRWLAMFRRVLERSDAGLIGASGSWAPGVTPLFPNAHVRTSAFHVTERVLGAIRVGPIITKQDAHEVEHGRHGLTRQVQAMHLVPYVVGKDGRAFAPEDWRASRTFYCGDQENLLVADNRTELYRATDPMTRRLLVEDAWGPFPAPDVGQTSSKFPL
jgi:hypothetical protein